MAKWDNHISPIEKGCKSCGELLLITDFRVLSKRRKNGELCFASLCIPCEADYFHERASKIEKNKSVKVENVEGEEWMPVNGFEELYQVSNIGRVKSLFKIVNHIGGSTHSMCERILKPKLNKNGYMSVTLVKDATNHYYSVHRIVAEAWLPNEDSKPQVNHKNGRKGDNRVQNLEWCTAQENSYHRANVLKHNPPKGSNNAASKMVLISCPDGKDIEIKGVAEACRILKLNVSGAHRVLRGEISDWKGYKFKYA